MNNFYLAMQSAYRTGAKDKRVGHDAQPYLHGARKGSAWHDWYMMGFDGLPICGEAKDAGVTA